MRDPGELRRRRVSRPRPGHADLAGVLKYDRLDARDILERASARETAARVAAGALAKRLLDEFGVEVGSHVVSLGGVAVPRPPELPVPLNDTADRSEVRVLDRSVEPEIVRRIDQAKQGGDTLGGEVEVVARGVVVGLGSHVSWDRKLDGRLAGLLMSIPAVKAVEIGMGVEAARRPGSQVHDAIHPSLRSGQAPLPPIQGDRQGGFRRRSNNAGGLEGGITTGEPVVARVAMKPISTLMSPLPTVDLSSGEPANAQSERSDVTAVPALGVIAEAMVAMAASVSAASIWSVFSATAPQVTPRTIRGAASRPVSLVIPPSSTFAANSSSSRAWACERKSASLRPNSSTPPLDGIRSPITCRIWVSIAMRASPSSVDARTRKR